MGVDNTNNIVKQWNRQGNTKGAVKTIRDQAVHGGKYIKEFPEEIQEFHFGVDQMFDSNPATIFFGEKNGRKPEDPMRQYRRIPFQFQVSQFSKLYR